MFADPFARIFDDPDYSADEPREIIIGYSQRQRLLLVSFMERAPKVRTSARAARPDANDRIMQKEGSRTMVASHSRLGPGSLTTRPVIVGMLAAALGAAGQAPQPAETSVPTDGASLYARTIGKGRPVIVLHGGPDFDQAYLLPEMDRLADAFRLIYYDQRGRGRSADNVRPEDVTLASDLDDLDRVRQHFRLDAPVLLGHSWGTVLALEYALRHPTRVSHLILMNPAPVSASQLART